MKYASLIIWVCFLVACNNSSNPEINTASTTEAIPLRVTLTAAQRQNARIETGKPEMRTLGNILKGNGFIEALPQNKISISMPLGGYLKQSKLLSGMQVRRGEILAILEDPQYITLQQEYLTANARLSYLSADLSRQETLNQDKSASDKALQLARSEYQMQKIMIKALSEKLKLIGLDPDRLSAETISKNIQIHSPINGFVADVKVNTGKYVSPTDVLFELINTDDIHLKVNVFEKDLADLRIGQRVMAYTNTDPDKKYPAKIILIGQKVGDDRSVTLHCNFDNPAQGLLPGMFMNAEIETAKNNALAVPNDALVFYGQKNYIFTVFDDATFDMVEVETGVSENGYTALTGTSSEMLRSKNIVTRNAYMLLMKMKNTEE